MESDRSQRDDRLGGDDSVQLPCELCVQVYVSVCLIDMWEGCRDMVKEDSDFDPIRAEPTFEELIRR